MTKYLGMHYAEYLVLNTGIIQVGRMQPLTNTEIVKYRQVITVNKMYLYLLSNVEYTR